MVTVRASLENAHQRIEARKNAGNYEGIHIGDYFHTSLKAGTIAGYSIPAQNFKCRIIGLNTYKSCADAAVGNMIYVSTDEVIDTPIKWNPTDNNNGTANQTHPWLASAMYAILNGVNNYSTNLMNLGAYMTPHVAYMQNIGLETLDARYRLQASNALAVAKALREVKKIKRVNYIGLEDNPYYELSRRQFGETSGAMLTIDLESQQACYNFINRLQLVRRATNLFDNKSLAIHPASTIFGNFTPRQREKMDVLDTTIRLSIGLEDAEDIIEDIVRAV